MSTEDLLFQKFGREFPEGTVIFREGDGGDQMFFIHGGKVRISKEIRGAEKLLAELEKGDLFGEMAILNDKPRSATATVSEAAQLIVINRKSFERMILGSTEIALRVVKQLAGRLQEADEQIENLMLRDASSRVVHFLVRLSRRGIDPIPQHPEDLVAELGLPFGEVTEVYGRLEKKGFIRVDEDGTHVPSVEKLAQFLEFLEMKEQFGED